MRSLSILYVYMGLLIVSAFSTSFSLNETVPDKTDRSFKKAVSSNITLPKIIKEETRWYRLLYKNNKKPTFSAKPDKLYGEINYNISGNSYVTMMVYDLSGNITKVVFNDVPHTPDHYNYSFSMDVSQLPKGKYYVRVFDGVQKKVEKVFEI